jgi:hypothetical protein
MGLSARGRNTFAGYYRELMFGGRLGATHIKKPRSGRMGISRPGLLLGLYLRCLPTRRPGVRALPVAGSP